MTILVFTNVLRRDLVLIVHKPVTIELQLSLPQVCFVNFIFLSVFYWSCVTERLVYTFLNKLGVWGNNSLLNHVFIS